MSERGVVICGRPLSVVRIDRKGKRGDESVEFVLFCCLFVCSHRFDLIVICCLICWTV